MKAVYSTFKRRVQKKKTQHKKPTRLYGLPKGEVTRRLSGVHCSLRYPEVEIREALGHVDDLLAHVRKLPCCMCGKRNSSEAHHVATRGARNPDFWNVIPACYGPDSCHQQAQDGHAQIDQAGTAIAITEAYLTDHPAVRVWLADRGCVNAGSKSA